MVQSYETSLKQFNEIIELYNLALEENNQSVIKESEQNIIDLYKNIDMHIVYMIFYNFISFYMKYITS